MVDTSVDFEDWDKDESDQFDEVLLKAVLAKASECGGYLAMGPSEYAWLLEMAWSKKRVWRSVSHAFGFVPLKPAWNEPW